MKNIEWKKSSIDYDKLNELTPQKLAAIETLSNYVHADKDKLRESSKKGGKKGGETNKQSGHMSNLGKQWGKINANHPNSLAASSINGKKNAENKFWEKLTFEQRSKGGKTSGRMAVESGHWREFCIKGAKQSSINRVNNKIEKYKEILNLIPTTEFTTADAKRACETYGYDNWKKFLKETTLITQTYKGNNQFNPSLYKKIV